MVFVVSVNYLVELEKIEPLIAAHREFLDKYYAQGIFLLSGPRVPRDGGLIMANCESKQRLLGILEQDPFKLEGVAEYLVVEFLPNKACSELQHLI